MARRRIDGTPVSRETGIQREPSRATGTTFVPVEARRLFTVEEDAKIWSGNDAFTPAWKGAIGRLRPPPGADDAAIERVKREALEAGATKVTVLPRRKADVVPQAVLEERKKFRSLAPREVVLKLVEGSGSQEKAALRGICEEVMSEVGL